MNLYSDCLDPIEFAMVYEDQLRILRNLGVAEWNKRKLLKHADEHIDFSGAILYGENLGGIDLRGADLSRAVLHGANLSGAVLWDADLKMADLSYTDLRGADLSRVDLQRAHLYKADLSKGISGTKLKGADLGFAYLIEANLSGADLTSAKLVEANLKGANLIAADLVETNLERSVLTNCRIFGISAWKLNLKDATQNDLIITPLDEPIVSVDNLEVAQFIYLLLHNEKIRSVIDTIAKKAVFILGRFTPERKAVLDAIRVELRNRGYLPILFDFDKPTTKDFTETIRILAGMSLFVIADISNPKSSPLELQVTIPDYMIPFVPIIQEGEEPFSMFRDLLIMHKKWVLPLLKYDSLNGLIRVLDEAIINPALEVHHEILIDKAAELPQRHVRDYKENLSSD